MFIYDIEIQHGIPPSDPAERQEEIVYCAGWEDYKNMKIACVGCYDYKTDKYRVFGEFELDELKELIDRSDRVIGFNNNRFDNAVLQANNVVVPPSKSYDILAEIYHALGSRQKGCRLENVIKANFPSSAGKTGSGADAPILWQRGFYTKVVDYCLNDVRLTKMIVDKILRFGYINNPISPGSQLYLKRP